ncbi:type I restriction system specificity protein [Planctomycetia bacterium]|nr:type I restriction system specificity protein [Planctomycetia bacterium]
MASEESVRLRDVCVKIGSGATPRGGKEAYKGGATSLIRSQNIYNDGFHRDGLVYIDDDQAAELRNVDVRPNDVLLNITGDSVARCCQVAADVLPARVNQHVAIIRPQPDALDAQFLRYVLVSHEYQSRLLALASAGATRPALTKAMIEDLDIPAYPLTEQRVIANILGVLDDKIELNRRMNETLEGLARAIFQSWFVDFDPVRAQRDGLPPPALSPATAALFPDSFHDSELGKIPKGWSTAVLDDVTGFLIGGDWGKEAPVEDATEAVLCIRGADIPSLQSGGVGKMPTRYLTASSLTKRRLRDGDIVFEISGGSPTQSTGRPVLATQAFLERLPLPLTCSNFCRLIRPAVGISSKYLYCLLRRLYHADEFLQYENGTTGIKNLAFTVFSSIHKFVLPPKAVMAAFEVMVAPIYGKMAQVGFESEKLAAIRDALLPKLLSGEIRVAEAERLVEDAG